MKFEKFALLFAVVAGGSPLAAAQNTNQTPAPSPTPKVETITIQATVSRERREQALAKLSEGQRNLTAARRSRARRASLSQLAKSAFQKAVELDPTLAEGYTALATLAFESNNVEESLLTASLAVRIEPKNFGSNVILARLYTLKSRVNRGIVEESFARKAIDGWLTVAALEPRNAEAWAFLSELYDKTGKEEEEIAALRKWIPSAVPLDGQFYEWVMGGKSSLTPENASLKLADALRSSGKTREAVEILSRLVADQSADAQAIGLLRETIAFGDAAAAAAAVEPIQQAVNADPSNFDLLGLLVQAQLRSGKTDEAAKILREGAAKTTEENKAGWSSLYAMLGDSFKDAKRIDEAARSFQTALELRGIGAGEPATDEQREFAAAVFEGMIGLYKNAARESDARNVIERARRVLGKDDLFADRQLIALLRETGRKEEALQAVRAVRVRFPGDYAMLNLEVSLLAETGKVDEAVALVKGQMEKAKLKSASGEIGDINALQMSDEFANYLLISNLYMQAGRGREAVEAANQAFALARSDERKQTAKLTLATAQQSSGDFDGAEATLREILKQLPADPVALNNLGYFLLERGIRFQEALEMIQKAVNAVPDNPYFLDSLGWAYFKLGKITEAEKYLKEALRYEESATILEHLGDVYQKQNKLAEAKAAWQKALTLATDAKDIARLKTKVK